MHRYEFIHGGRRVIPYAVKLLPAEGYVGVAQFRLTKASGPVLVDIKYSDREFPTEAEARDYAEQRARLQIDEGSAP